MEAHPTAGAGRGGSSGVHTFIDIPAPLLQSPDIVGEQLRETANKNVPRTRETVNENVPRTNGGEIE
jgi:hypothetical protein